MAFSGFDSVVTPAFSPAQGSSSFKEDFYSTDLSPAEQLIIAKGLSLKKVNESEAGPRGIGEYGTVGEAVDDGNCFYDAVFQQMSLEQQQSVGSYSVLRQQIDPSSTKEKWTDTPQVRQFARQYRCVVAIIDTRYPRLGFHIYYVNERGVDSDSHNPEDVPSQRIFRLAYNGNHYMPVELHVAFAQGAIRNKWQCDALAVEPEELNSSPQQQLRDELPLNQTESSSFFSSLSKATTSSSEFNMQQFASDTVEKGTFIRNLKGNINLRNTNAPRLPVGLGVDEATGDINVGDSVTSDGAQPSVSTSQNSIETTVNINNFHGSLNAGSGSQKQLALMLHPDRIKEIHSSLQESYQSQLKLKRISDGQEVELHEKYINVAIIKEEELRKKENKLQSSEQSGLDKGNKEEDKLDTEEQTNPSRLPPNFEALRQVKEPVELASLYVDDAKAKEQFKGEKQHLMLGRAGIGKTTLCQYIVAKHASGELWNDKFDWVFWAPLRLLRHYANQDDVKLWQVLYETAWEGLGLTEEEAESLWEHVKAASASGKVLWLLDGYDEIVNLANNKTIKLLLAELRKMPCHILTSRPYGVGQLNYQSRLETIGFTDAAINEYVNRYFDVSERSSSLLALLKRNQRLRSLMSIPINADLICGLRTKKINPAELSMTGLYSNLVDTLLVRAPDDKYVVDKTEKEAKEAVKPQLRRKEKSPTVDKNMVKFLSQLAWDNLGDTENSIIITEQQRIQALFKIKIEDEGTQLKILDKAFDSGLLKSIGTLNQQKHKNHPLVYTGDCYFIHLTFQDFFAAQHVVRILLYGSKKEQEAIKKAICQNKYNPYYYFVWAFVAGLLKDDKNGNAPVVLEDFFDLLLEEPRDMVGLYQLGMLMQCTEECLEEVDLKNQLKGQRISQLEKHGTLILDIIKEWVFVSLGYRGFLIRNWFATQLQLVPHLVSSGFLHHILSEKIDTKMNANVRLAALSILRNCGQPIDSKLAEDVFSILFKTACSQDLSIQSVAREALRKWGWPNDLKLVQEILKKLNEDVRSRNNYIRSVALVALKNWGWPADRKLAQEALRILLEFAYDKNFIVKNAIQEGFRNWGWPADFELTQAAFKMLSEAASSPNIFMQLAALYALGSWGQPTDSTLARNALKILLEATHSEDDDVRCVALNALGNWGWPTDFKFAQAAFKILLEAAGDRYQPIKIHVVPEALRKWVKPADPNLAQWALIFLETVSREYQNGFVGSMAKETLRKWNQSVDLELTCSKSTNLKLTNFNPTPDQVMFKKLLKDASSQDRIVQVKALETLRGLGKPADFELAQNAFKTIIGVGSKNNDAQHLVLYTLESWGWRWPVDFEFAQTAFKIFFDAFESQHSLRQQQALETLLNWGWPDDPKLAKLMTIFLLEKRHNTSLGYESQQFLNQITQLFNKMPLIMLLEQITLLDNSQYRQDYCKMIYDKAISLNTAIYFYQDGDNKKDGSYTIYYYEQNQRRQQSLTPFQFRQLEQQLAELNPILSNVSPSSSSSSSSVSSSSSSSDVVRMERQDEVDQITEILKQHKRELERDGLLLQANENQGMLYYLIDDENGKTSREKIDNYLKHEGGSIDNIKASVEADILDLQRKQVNSSRELDEVRQISTSNEMTNPHGASQSDASSSSSSSSSELPLQSPALLAPRAATFQSRPSNSSTSFSSLGSNPCLLSSSDFSDTQPLASSEENGEKNPSAISEIPINKYSESSTDESEELADDEQAPLVDEPSASKSFDVVSQERCCSTTCILL